jgi:hypothetical protein
MKIARIRFVGIRELTFVWIRIHQTGLRDGSRTSVRARCISLNAYGHVLAAFIMLSPTPALWNGSIAVESSANTACQRCGCPPWRKLCALS